MLFDACVPSQTHNSTVRVACTLVTLLAMGCGLYRKASWPDIGRTSVDVQLAGNQTRALDRAGTVTCWTSDLTAHAVALPAPAINFSLHDPVSCAVLRDQRVFCWGCEPVSTENNPKTVCDPFSARPIPVPPARQIAITRSGVCVLDSQSNVRCSPSDG